MLPLPCGSIARSSSFMLSSVPSTLVSKVAAKLSATENTANYPNHLSETSRP